MIVNGPQRSDVGRQELGVHDLARPSGRCSVTGTQISWSGARSAIAARRGRLLQMTNLWFRAT
eukprot:6207021-Pleurochrysis_carterae.AAC.3